MIVERQDRRVHRRIAVGSSSGVGNLLWDSDQFVYGVPSNVLYRPLASGLNGVSDHVARPARSDGIDSHHGPRRSGEGEPGLEGELIEDETDTTILGVPLIPIF